MLHEITLPNRQVLKHTPTYGKNTPEIKQSILEYAFQMKRNGKADTTITSTVNRLQRLTKLCNIHKPEEVKTILANLQWKNSTKRTVTNMLTNYFKFLKLEWQEPRYKPQDTLPFIPTEEELNNLISAGRKKIATLLQTLKETGARIGEIINYLKWSHIDLQRKLITITPEKGSNSRILPISNQLIDMLNNLKRNDERVFPTTTDSARKTYYSLRQRTIKKLGNPRLKQISFHTFRHWKGTMEYHKTKDIIHVKTILGHKSIKSTMKYINLENAIFQTTTDQYHIKTAKTLQEATQLLEVGFEYITEMDNTKLFRKRK